MQFILVEQLTKKNETKLQRVGIAYMWGYFEHAMPSVIDALPDNIKKLDPNKLEQLDKEQIKELYKTLATIFDRETGAGEIDGVESLSGLVERLQTEFKDEEEVTTDILKTRIGQLKEGHKKGIAAKLIEHALSTYITHLPPGLYSKHIAKKLKRRGMELDNTDQLVLMKQNPATLAGDLHIPYIRRDYDNMKAQKHGFKSKSEREERREYEPAGAR